MGSSGSQLSHVPVWSPMYTSENHFRTAASLQCVFGDPGVKVHLLARALLGTFLPGERSLVIVISRQIKNTILFLDERILKNVLLRKSTV